MLFCFKLSTVELQLLSELHASELPIILIALRYNILFKILINRTIDLSYVYYCTVIRLTVIRSTNF